MQIWKYKKIIENNTIFFIFSYFIIFLLPAKPVLVLDDGRPPACPWKALAAHFSPAGGVVFRLIANPQGF